MNAACAFLLHAVIVLAPAQQAPIEVEPEGLGKRKDLLGREVIVDDRVKIFFPMPGKEPIIVFARTDVTVVLPKGLTYNGTPTGRSARARGILKRQPDGNGFYIEATQVPERFRDDIHRLKAVMSTLSPEDAEARSGWGDWAAKRADAFGDDDLKALAMQLQTEAIELEYRKPRSLTPETFLTLAKKARAKKLSEPLPSAIAHTGFRLRLASAKTLEDYQRLADEVKAFLPDAKTPAKAGITLPTEAYEADPYKTYRDASQDIRWALDRRLWTDAVAPIFRLRSAGDPNELKALGEEAKALLPDRPEIGGDLKRRHFEHLDSKVEDQRESAMADYANTVEKDLNDPVKAESIRRRWLNSRRKKLATDDAEQRVDLAKLYLKYVNDKAIWIELLREALKIDPTNREAEDAFQRKGYVKTNGEWRDPRDPSSKPAAPTDTADLPAEGKDDPLIGLTPAEVKAQLGEPKTITRIASQGRVSMQWIYEGTRGSQYIDFVQRASDPQPVVTARFSVR